MVLHNIAFITGNQGKFNEIQAFFAQAGLDERLEKVALDLVEIQEVDPQKIIEAKLQEARKSLPDVPWLLVEDTSLSLDGMNGLPGPLIKWFLKTIGNDGLVRLTDAFGKKATATTILGLMAPDHKTFFFTGQVQGVLVPPRSFGYGFGWAPIFEPVDQKGDPRTFAQMIFEEKSAYSMRGKAVQKLIAFLQKNGLR